VTLSIVFPAPDVRLSMNDRTHWARKARITKEWRQAAFTWSLNAVSHGLTRPQPPSRVKVVFEVKDPWRRRDPHNLAPTVKAIVDGMVDAHIWPDDSSKWVTIDDPEFRRELNGAPVRVVRVELTPRENQ
jgi:hypothetical protein